MVREKKRVEWNTRRCNVRQSEVAYANQKAYDML